VLIGHQISFGHNGTGRGRNSLMTFATDLATLLQIEKRIVFNYYTTMQILALSLQFGKMKHQYMTQNNVGNK
jgi:hypothetical protein